jgi:NADH-quinone oxidoreductase subunit C
MTDTIVEKLNGAFPSSVKGHSEFRDTNTVQVDPDQWHDVALFLRDDADLHYNLLVDVYGIDRLKLRQTPRFAVNYELYSIPNDRFLRIIVTPPDHPAETESQVEVLNGLSIQDKIVRR